MAAVSESIVREYFELHGFLVCQQRKYTSAGKRTDDDIGFFVMNPRLASALGAVSGVLTSEDLSRIAHAVVVVKGWHTETFGPGVLTHAPQIFRFLEPKALKQAAQSFGADKPLAKILVVPALPRNPEPRQQTIDLLRTKGIDAVISFHTILRDLIDTVEANRNYQKSDLLQILRILKNYDFLKETQMEFFRTKKKALKAAQSEPPLPSN